MMAPKSALLTAGTEDLKPKTGPPKNIPWTTREKQAAIEVKKSKQPVKRSLPPPGEMTEDADSEAKRKWRKKKPRTTKEKLKDAEEKRRATQGGQSKTKANAGGKKKEAKGERYSVYKAVREQHTASTHQDTTKKAKPSVLVRPTERAKRAKTDMKRKDTTVSDAIHPGLNQIKKAPLTISTETAAASDTMSRTKVSIDWALFRLLDLPDVVRKRIWELSVVYPDHFIWPQDKIDHEQPDIAMVNRQIRSEVLPIYYRQNTFAVALIASGKGKADSKNEMNGRGLAAITRWSTVLEEKGWFNYIKKFAFDYTPQTITDSPHIEEQAGMVVCVKLEKNLAVQVHRDARCLLPGRIEFEGCRPSKNAAWLDELAASVVKDSKGSKRMVMSGKMLVELAEAVMAAADELLEIRCKDVSHRKRADSAVGDV